MKITLNVEVADDDVDVDAIDKLIRAVGMAINEMTGATVTYDSLANMSVSRDKGGSGSVWALWVGNHPVWTHAAIEGPPPDAIELWNRLSDYLPLHDDDEDTE